MSKLIDDFRTYREVMHNSHFIYEKCVILYMDKIDVLNFYRSTAIKREKWNRRNRFYHRLLEKYFSFIIPSGKLVLELGCGSGDLLNTVKPAYGAGIDFASEVIDIAVSKYLNIYQCEKFRRRQ